MAWRVGLAALLVAWSLAADARHGSGLLDPRHATPGIRLELVALPPAAPAGTARYRVRLEGVPRGVAFGIWTKSFNSSDFNEVLPGFRAEEDGSLVSLDASGARRLLGDFVLEPGPYFKGAAWTVAFASDDHKLSAFARIIPYPIGARDGNCAVSLELASVHGDRFVTTGTGFAPGEMVDVEMRHSGRVTHKRQRASADGRLPAELLSLGAATADRSARYAVKAAACEPVIEYEWGEAALKRR